MTGDIDEAIDWQGRQVDCGPCTHRGVNEGGRCALKHACVRDRYARRIDRFFTWNPELSNAYLDHPHFEVRAIAAKFADLVLLPPLLADPDETVRWNAVCRLPRRYLLLLREDPHREVRIRVASLLEVRGSRSDDARRRLLRPANGCAPSRRGFAARDDGG